MRYLATRIGLIAAAFCASVVLSAASIAWSEYTQDVIIIGEHHDNPAHHTRQYDSLLAIQPKAVVFEMLTPHEAERLADVPRNAREMQAASAGFHWTNIADYADVLAASSVIVGAALSREDMRAAFGGGAAATFGAGADVYGLTIPLGQTQQETRQALQFEAHCGAMALEMMGGMVDAQRLRDAVFARTVIEALDTYGAPVVLITGNGHARLDWAVPSYLRRVRPDLSVASIGQGEDGKPPAGLFSAVITDAPAPDRGDPCAAFQSKN